MCDTADDHTIYVVRTSAVEIVAALFRRARMGSLSPADAQAQAAQFKNDMRHDYEIIEVTENLVATAMALCERRRVRGYDAVQLAAALELHTMRTAFGLAPLTLVCADAELNAAAAAEGLAVDDPSMHA